ncbi:chemoreceptor glutamine deamidase CheD [Roseibium sp.]|uniref:chemoreceptor glutamine deamidase CheD n=1 Tax=Roseibium sp. TaxID=1936156 RepID=UPI003D0A15ED
MAELALQGPETVACSPSAAKADVRAPQIVRSYDHKQHKYAVRLLPGASYTTSAADEVIVTVLGSCVAACIRNPITGFGGMNHFMLPEHETGDWNGVSSALRYGNHAMEALINAVLKSGCARHDLEIKLFGGANLYQGVALVGDKNAEFARAYLEREGLAITAEDLGGPRGRRIHYEPATGRVQRLLLKQNVERKVVNAECSYISDLRRADIEGEIELFG